MKVAIKLEDESKYTNIELVKDLIQDALAYVDTDIGKWSFVEDEQQAKLTQAASGLTGQELIVMNCLVDAWNAALELSLTNDERHVFTQAIHQAQQVLAMRVVRRDHPHYWRN